MPEHADFALADEIARGMRARCKENISRSERTVIGVAFSTADVLYLLDAYEELRREGKR